MKLEPDGHPRPSSFPIEATAHTNEPLNTAKAPLQKVGNFPTLNRKMRRAILRKFPFTRQARECGQEISSQRNSEHPLRQLH
jgi:hypothetical protein